MSSVIVGQYRACKSSIKSQLEYKAELKESSTNPYLTQVWLNEVKVLFKKFDRENTEIINTRWKK